MRVDAGVGGRGCRAELKLVRVLVFWYFDLHLTRPATSLKRDAADLVADAHSADPFCNTRKITFLGSILEILGINFGQFWSS